MLRKQSTEHVIRILHLSHHLGVPLKVVSMENHIHTGAYIYIADIIAVAIFSIQHIATRSVLSMSISNHYRRYYSALYASSPDLSCFLLFGLH